jgi:hypothetical protein
MGATVASLGTVGAKVAVTASELIFVAIRGGGGVGVVVLTVSGDRTAVAASVTMVGIVVVGETAVGGD